MAETYRTVPALDARRIALFWAKVEKTESCWLWTGGHTQGFQTGHGSRLAARVGWWLVHGEQPPNRCLRRTCGNPWCVHPDHHEIVQDFRAWARNEFERYAASDPRVLAKFEARVVRRDGCWAWLGATDESGYGQLGLGHPGRWIGAHRLSWAMAHDGAPAQDCVLHHCDTPSCTRPDHLFQGSIQDNNADMLAKGRHRGGGLPGELSASAKLRASDVADIRARRLGGETLTSIAADYPVGFSAISKITTGRNWRSV